MHQKLFREYCFSLLILTLLQGAALAEMKTWDGKHSIERIAVRAVYFVPKDRQPLPDWRERVDYYCQRILQFHEREYGGQSSLTTDVHAEPFISERTTEQLREGDGDAIFFKTLREVDQRLKFAQDNPAAFPILLVFSEINWRPLDDFYRVRPGRDGLEFEGNFTNQQHFPGARSGGARATYLAAQRKGWGLVSADGWRVPYRGSDCVVYHEGVGHTIGLPHPQPGNGSVMSLGQYRGWISESWLDKEQKLRLNWNPDSPPKLTPQQRLFTEFRALPEPIIPKPNEIVSLKLDWPEGVQVQKLQTEIQTSLHGPWVKVHDSKSGTPIEQIEIGRFDRPAPVSYRVRTTTQDGSTAELYGYFQVRRQPQENPLPVVSSLDIQILEEEQYVAAGEEVDLLEDLNLDDHWHTDGWQLDESGKLVSPKKYGAKIELQNGLPENYQLVIIAEPLDTPNGLLLGTQMKGNRFVTLINYTPEDVGLSALENVDGQNVGNTTTLRKSLFKQTRLSQIVVTVQGNQITAKVDGEEIINWRGDPQRLTLGDYWQTPNKQAFFLGTYDCRYRFHRVGMTELKKKSVKQ